ncbi:MAG: D-alanyl-D-alanine carboxypeptidase [Oscillospiraceae bacterium]|jgi:D-alanyl-D-alanine carboxypeptidase|nr:D-alanyl-D-alanine carboxypeptidase [Oscillospiraceae bacterium]
MKRVLSICLSALTIITAIFPTSVAAQAVSAPTTSAKSAILIDADSGETLYEQDADIKLQIASTTKILTALVVLERCRLDETVVIKPAYTTVEGSSMYLKAGEKRTVRELLYGLMLSSGNDAAVALACHTAGSIDDFAKLMNATADKLGCANSDFKNPHGLDAAGHGSTASDLAKITAAAMKNPDFAAIVSTKTISVAGRELKNHNRLLWDLDGALGVKTGYTKSSGRSLVSCAERDGLRLVCVTLSDPNDWADHASLFDWGFSEYKSFSVTEADVGKLTIPVISGEAAEVSVKTNKDYSFCFKRDDSIIMTVNVPRFVYASAVPKIVRGARAGELVLRRNGEIVTTIPLFYAATVPLDANTRLGALERMKWAWYFTNNYANYTGYRFYG